MDTLLNEITNQQVYDRASKETLIIEIIQDNTVLTITLATVG